jgi:hypothetical protein
MGGHSVPHLDRALGDVDVAIDHLKVEEVLSPLAKGLKIGRTPRSQRDRNRGRNTSRTARRRSAKADCRDQQQRDACPFHDPKFRLLPWISSNYSLIAAAAPSSLIREYSAA